MIYTKYAYYVSLSGELLEYKHQNEQMSFELSRTRDELDVLKKHLQVACKYVCVSTDDMLQCVYVKACKVHMCVHTYDNKCMYVHIHMAITVCDSSDRIYVHTCIPTYLHIIDALIYVRTYYVHN